MTALRTSGISMRYGSLVALNGVDLEVAAGARHALIGPNGAGKTTLINVLSGAIAPTGGDVYLHDERITMLPQHLRARRGLTRTFQVTQLFPELTVLESIALAILEREGRGWRWWPPVARFEAQLAEAHALMERLGLESDASRRVGRLPYGRQRLVEIALGLAANPRVLLLDEPAAGIPSGESADVLGVVADLPRDVTIVFIEHDMDLVFRFAERVTVLVAGRVLIEGSPDEIARDEHVRAVYLGREA
ncbi:MAG TPA: ABC transporter ATP-binding protein [Usitatibacter sp.]|nr:ABC transporter ATP-binding protein [Usitatibacter sp.]